MVGQRQMTSCMCIPGYWKDPSVAGCDVQGECCSVCPTPGGRCLGGISTQLPQGGLSYNGGIAKTARYFDVNGAGSGAESKPYYHMMPFARKGYYRISGPVEGTIAQCSPAAVTTDDGFANDAGACLGGIFQEEGSVQYDNVCAKGYAQAFMCARCVRGYYKNGARCLECPSTNPVVLTIMGIFVVCFIYLFAKYARHLNGLASPRIFYNFLIATASFLFFKIAWPREIIIFMEIVSKYLAININLLKSQCEIPDLTFLQVTFITFATPVALGEIFALIYVSELLVRKFNAETRFEASDGPKERAAAVVRGMVTMGNEFSEVTLIPLLPSLSLST